MKISVRRLIAVSICMLSLLRAPWGHAIPPNNARVLSQETYLLKEALYTGLTKPGQLGDTIGNLDVCAVITTGHAGRGIKVTVSMPDSGQIISISEPLKTLRDGTMIFDITDDAWGNYGHGTLKLSGKIARLELVKSGSKPGAVKNVGRNYGKFLLSRGLCRVPF